MGICAGGWPFAAQIPIAFSKAAFRVAMVSPAHSSIKQVNSIQEHFLFRPWAPYASIKSAITDWCPDLLICFDDQAVRALHRIHQKFEFDRDPRRRRLARLIEYSLGDPAHFATLRSSSAVVKLAESINIRCPKTIVLHNTKELQQQLHSIAYPILLKADGSEGGRGVRYAQSECDIVKAIGELLLPMGSPRGIKRVISGPFLTFLQNRRAQWGRNISLQQYISGYPANRAVACWNGKVLAGISVKAVETVNEFGPASVVRIIDNAEMSAVAEQLVRRFQLSGFVGFDFIIDRRNAAWFLEINPRATPVAHLEVDGVSLLAAVAAQLGINLATADFSIKTDTTIALFPHVLARSQSNGCLGECYLDIPREEPDFVRACLESMSAHDSNQISHIRPIDVTEG